LERSKRSNVGVLKFFSVGVPKDVLVNQDLLTC